MNFPLISLLRRSVLLAAGLVLAAALPARADFLLSFVNDTGGLYDDGNDSTFITFVQGASGNLGVGGPAISYSGGGISESYSIADINAAGGFDFADSADARNFYITYGSDGNISYGAQINPGDSSAPRYSYIELAGGKGDISQINQFGGSVEVQDYTSGNVFSMSAYNNLNTGASFQAIYSGISGNLSDPAVVTEDYNGTTIFKRIVGPSTLSNGYPSYSTYLTHLNTIDSVSNLTNSLNPPLGPGTIGMNNWTVLNGTTNQVGNQTWQATYNFTAAVDSGGNIVYNGSITVAGAGNTSGNIVTYNGLYIVEPNDANLTTALYGQNPSTSTVFGNVTGSIATDSGNASGNFSSTWADLNTYVVGLPMNGNFSNSNLVVLGQSQIDQKIVGDFSEGLATGFVGSPTYGSDPSVTWWTLADKAYTNGAQAPGSGYYNPYGETSFAESSLYNGTTTIVGGAIYTSPYDDRFNSNLLDADAQWVVTLLPDGDLAVTPVPEPATDALLVSGAALAAVMVRRRKNGRPSAEI